MNSRATAWSVAEEQLEDISGDPTKPGKFICVNNGDEDNDGVPNYADGFDKWGNSGRGAGGNFTPLILELAEPIDLTTAKIKFTYSVSNPDGVLRTGSGTLADPYIFTPPASGHLRIWKENGSANRLKTEVSAGGHFINSGSEYMPSDIGVGRLLQFFVEGVDRSLSLADQQITVEIDPDGLDPAPFMCLEALRCSIIHMDIDIDSDNDDAFSIPEKDDNEDQREDIQGIAERPGKFIEVNHNDDDHDCIPDFADGFDSDGISSNVDDVINLELLTPICLKFSEAVDITHAKLKITYSDSDPSLVTRNGTEALYSWEPEPGAMRLWKKAGDQARNKNSVAASTDPGDYIPTGEYNDLTKLGFSAGSPEIVLYLEAVNPSLDIAVEQIKFEMDPDGAGSSDWVCMDAVRVTCVKASLDIDSDNNNAIEECDDPIEAEEPGAILPKDLEGDGPGEDYLKPINLEVSPVIPGAKIILEAGTGIKIWEDLGKTNEVILPKEYTPATLPSILYLDGITKGAKPNILLKYKDTNNLEIATDKIKALITETPSWAPAKADVAYTWQPCIGEWGEASVDVFCDEIAGQGWPSAVRFQDSNCRDTNVEFCTLANYKSLCNAGIINIDNHGWPGVTMPIYAQDADTIDAWIGTETNITRQYSALSGFYYAEVTTAWLANNWATSLEDNKSIIIWSSCFSASVMDDAGGRWRIGYTDETTDGENIAVNEIFFTADEWNNG